MGRKHATLFVERERRARESARKKERERERERKRARESKRERKRERERERVACAFDWSMSQLCGEAAYRRVIKPM